MEPNVGLRHSLSFFAAPRQVADALQLSMKELCSAGCGDSTE